MPKHSASIGTCTTASDSTTISWRIPMGISFLLLFALSFESIPLPIRAQIVPPTSILALLLLPFIITHTRLTPLTKAVIFFVSFVLLHSLIALFIDVAFFGAEQLRILAWARQVIALIAGLSVFLVLKRTLTSVSDQLVIYAIILGALPALLLAILNIHWGITGGLWSGDIVTGIRSTLIPLGYNSPTRASGFSLEPSHFAFYLVVVFLPVCLTAIIVSNKRTHWFILLGSALAAFIWTLSATGAIVLLAFVFSGIFLGPKRGIFIVIAVVLLLSGIAFLILFPNNYMTHQINSLISGQWTGSIINRFYSTFAPFETMLSSYTSLGYGLGGTTTHFTEIVPPIAQQEIASASWEGMENLRTLTGRIVAETGLTGLSLYALIIIVCLQQLKSTIIVEKCQTNIALLKSARLALIAYLVGSSIGHGSFALPYLWFWLAFVDSRYIISMRKRHL